MALADAVYRSDDIRIQPSPTRKIPRGKGHIALPHLSGNDNFLPRLSSMLHTERRPMAQGSGPATRVLSKGVPVSLRRMRVGDHARRLAREQGLRGYRRCRLWGRQVLAGVRVDALDGGHDTTRWASSVQRHRGRLQTCFRQRVTRNQTPVHGRLQTRIRHLGPEDEPTNDDQADIHRISTRPTRLPLVLLRIRKDARQGVEERCDRPRLPRGNVQTVRRQPPYRTNVRRLLPLRARERRSGAGGYAAGELYWKDEGVGVVTQREV